MSRLAGLLKYISESCQTIYTDAPYYIILYMYKAQQQTTDVYMQTPGH